MPEQHEPMREGSPPEGANLAPTKTTVPLSTAPPASAEVAPPSGRVRAFRPLRHEIPLWQALACGMLGLLVCYGIWTWLTWGETGEDRILSPLLLPSPSETFASFHDLWVNARLTRNTGLSLRRVALGFGLAAFVGIPLGVLCGCFRRMNAFLAPLTIVGRNAPIAAIIPLTFAIFGYGEFQKVMFIFIACVAFIVMDTANGIAAISERYVDSAYTLGANRRQIIMKVLVPLAMPSVFNSMRLLFGLAFGYIMLAEVVQVNNALGLGGIINLAQGRGGNRGFIILVLLIIPLVALAIDRALYWVQRQLFPYYYGGEGLLHHAFVRAMRGWEALVALFRKPVAPPTAPGQQG
jgi:NitT/TauT family transport system permease protein